MCKGPHYAPKCNLASRLEILILLTNRLYRTNIANERDGLAPVTLEEICNRESVRQPTAKEISRLEEIYKPLKDKEMKKSRGQNDKAYCHYCHSSGHWTRDCLIHCPYCDKHGHGWSSCTNPEYEACIRERKELLKDKGSFNFVCCLSAIDSTDETVEEVVSCSSMYQVDADKMSNYDSQYGSF